MTRPAGRSLPFPFRVAAGVAASVAEGAFRLPRTVVELPVTIASHAMQTAMRIQQHATELAIKGDQALSVFAGTEEEPEWATFDEDMEPAGDGASEDAEDVEDIADIGDVADVANVTDSRNVEDAVDDIDVTIVTNGSQHSGYPQGNTGGRDEPSDAPELPARCQEYPHLSIPQLRARLRQFSVADLESLLDYERAHAARPDYIGMLTRRIATVRDAG